MNNHNKFLKDHANAIRILSADAIENAKSGHPGLPLGMADFLTILAKNHLVFNPNSPRWFGRDRLVLSAGHGSMLLYSFYYLAGYDNFSIEDIKNFRKLNSKTAGHPEYGHYPAIETTTGPLGQGLANSVGMAIAQKKYHSKLGDFANYKIYTIVGDGCLMEGIGYESASISGHLGLDNLIIIHDDNSITIDGKTSLTISEDQKLKFSSQGWDVIEIDGHNFDDIEKALQYSKSTKKPLYISCKTIIGFGAGNKAGTEKCHGSPLGDEMIKELRKNLNWSDEKFYIPEDILNNWKNFWKRNEDYYNKSVKNFESLSESDRNFIKKPNFTDITTSINKDFAKKDFNNSQSTRVSMGNFVNYLQTFSEKFIVGSADLSESNILLNKNSHKISNGDFSGNFIHYGIRENAMAGIMNGLSIEGFTPIGGTFLVFSDYMRPGIRLASIMGLDNIFIMTHDSIGVGEDGPTHQPVEHLASFRAMPDIYVFRPADEIETYYSLTVAINEIKNSPKLFCLTRQNVPLISSTDKNYYNDVKKGAYIFDDKYCDKKHDINIWATGSELSIALDVKKLLLEKNIIAKVISAPCLDLFFKQDQAYIDDLIEKDKLNIAIEAACKFGWESIIGREGLFFGVNNFGKSAHFSEIFSSLSLSADKICDIINSKLQK